MPKNTGAGFIISASASWSASPDLANVAAGRGVLRGMMAAIIVHTFNYKRDYYIPADK
jgi:cytochrome o ubiquinol oxidase subunit 1